MLLNIDNSYLEWLFTNPNIQVDIKNTGNDISVYEKFVNQVLKAHRESWERLKEENFSKDKLDESW